MKKQASKPLDELTVDVLDYMFVEWLIRHSLYSKFAKNLSCRNPGSGNPRSIVRDFIRDILSSPAHDPSDLLWCSFPFDCTLEGFRFWAFASCEWDSYLKSFSKIF